MTVVPLDPYIAQNLIHLMKSLKYKDDPLVAKLMCTTDSYTDYQQ